IDSHALAMRVPGVILLLVLVVVVLVVLAMLVVRGVHVRHAVLCGEPTDREPERRALAEPGRAERGAFGIEVAVRHDADRGIVVRIARGGAGNLVVVRAAARGIDVPRDAVAAAVDRERTAAEPRRGIRTKLDRGGEPVFGYRLREAVRDGVHDAA